MEDQFAPLSPMPLPAHRQTPSAVSDAPSLDSIARPLSAHSIAPHAFYDLVIIGAGPAALAVVARILETRPAALYTEQEHHFLHWLSKSGGGGQQRNAAQPGRNPRHLRLIRTKASGRGAERIIAGERALHDDEKCACPGEMKILVVDKVGQGWLSHWNNMFKALEIQHLRSPLFFHPCPADLDSLLAYAHRHGRNTLGDALFASPISSRAHRGRDTKVKRLDRYNDRYGAGELPDEVPAGRSRKPDLVEIPGVVGAEKSKHKKCKQRKDPHKYGKMAGDSGGAVNERERKDYFTPSTELFRDFVEEDIVKRYGLSTKGNWPASFKALSQDAERKHDSPVTTVKGEVNSMRWAELTVGDEEAIEAFYLKTTDGAAFGAKAVVSATGPAGQPSFPDALKAGSTSVAEQPLAAGQKTHPPGSHLHGLGWCHSAAMALPSLTFPPPSVQAKRTEKSLLVIGGGLTSAQVCDLALRKGFDKVKLVLRGHLKVKPFDISLDWMGRYSNLRKMQFWQEEDPTTRLKMWRDARQGGSMTQPYAKLMKRYEEAGRLEICAHTELEEVEWREDEERWSVWTRRNVPDDPKEKARESYLRAQLQDGEEEEQGEDDDAVPAKRQPEMSVDYIVTATAFKPDFQSLPWISQVAQQYPLKQEGGLPLLSEHLQYGKLPLFAVGLYSALQIGPAAGNLGGIREGADRVVTQLQALIQPPVQDAEDEAEDTNERDTPDLNDESADIAPLATSPRVVGGAHRTPHREFGHLGFGALALEG